MARAVFLASLFTAVAYAARVAERQADVHVSDFFPRHAVGPHMPPIVKPTWTSHRPSLHAKSPFGTQFMPRSQLSAMAMQTEVEDIEAVEPNVPDRRTLPEEPKDNRAIGGPILKPSVGDFFDSACVANPVVLPPSTANGRWQMYYYGNPGTWANETRGFLPTGYIGLAESDDGIHWEKVPGKADLGSILAPTGGKDDFDGLQIGIGDVLRIGEKELHMYYFGGSFEEVNVGPQAPPAKGLRMRIGKARSMDGGRSWERLGEVLDYDPREGLFASWPRIIVPNKDSDDNAEDEPWRMLYHAFNGTRWAAFEATSHDEGKTWSRDGKMALGPGDPSGWDGGGVGTRAVARTKNGELVMVYEAVEQGGTAGKHRLGLARWDNNGGVWKKDTEITGIPGGPILEPGVEPLDPWTALVIGTPYLVVAEDGSMRLYFCSKKDNDMSMSIGLVESKSGDFDPSSWKSISPDENGYD